jgi:hypothetical protein
MIVRKTFPQVYMLEHPEKGRYWLMSARKKKLGMNERKTFNNEDEAQDCARQIEQRIVNHGKGPELPAEKLQAARSYATLLAKLAVHGRTPEEAADHFLTHLGNEVVQQAKPLIRVLAEDWKKFKYLDTTLSRKTVIEIRSYARFIKNWWGDLKPDELKKTTLMGT